VYEYGWHLNLSANGDFHFVEEVVDGTIMGKLGEDEIRSVVEPLLVLVRSKRDECARAHKRLELEYLRQKAAVLELELNGKCS
jgi:hypothetical protein